MSFVSKRSGRCEYKRPCEDSESALYGQGTTSHNQDGEKEDEDPSSPRKCLAVGRVVRSRKNVPGKCTRNDCEDEREAEEEERMAIKILPVESA